MFEWLAIIRDWLITIKNKILPPTYINYEDLFCEAGKDDNEE